MNNRIYEIGTECKLFMERTHPGGFPNEGLMVANDFAISIIKECAEVASCNGHVSGFELGDLILEHFGLTHEDVHRN